VYSTVQYSTDSAFCYCRMVCPPWGGALKERGWLGSLYSTVRSWFFLCSVVAEWAPPLGWADTAAYLVLPILLVASQYYSMQLLQPATVSDVRHKAPALSF